MPFSISSGIGFIALFGISVLNGIVLMSAIKSLSFKDFQQFKDLIVAAGLSRLRPVLMTAMVAAFGFLPMALSTGSGAEVQQPLATVVIGGLISSTLLTLLILPTLYFLTYKKQYLSMMGLVVLGLFSMTETQAQPFNDFDAIYKYALQQHPEWQKYTLAIQQEGLQKEAIGQWSPLEVTYQGGQINYQGYDHFFTVEQNLNHLFDKKIQTDLVDSQVTVLRQEQQLWAHQWRWKLRDAYDIWLYQNAKQQLTDSLLQRYEQLEPKLQLRVEVGEMELLDMELYQTQRFALQQQLLLEKQQTQLALTQFKQQAFLPDTAQISLATLEAQSLPDLPVDSINLIYVNMLQSKKNQLQQQTQWVEQQAKRPNIRVGYFLQSLEKNFAFQGVSLGIGIPLDKRESQVKKEQLMLEQQQLEQDQRKWEYHQQNRLQLLQQNVAELQQRMQTYEELILPRQLKIRRIAQLQLEQGAIDFLTFHQIQQQVLRQQSEQLDYLYQHNQQVAELLFILLTDVY